MLTIAHIINPVMVPENSDLFIAQPITFETMRIARDFAKSEVNIELFSAQYREDRAMVPSYLTKTPDLERSIRDISNKPGEMKKLPFIKDILDCLIESSNADFLIYTNVDIALAQNFYLTISNFVEQGFDAFSITRRTISNRFRSIDDIPQMYLEKGEPHLGWDCFIFRRNLYPHFELEDVVIGAPIVGYVLICNCLLFAKQFNLFKEEHLTFHIGDEGNWRKRRDGANILNVKNCLRAIRKLHRNASATDRKVLLNLHFNSMKQVLAHHRNRKKRVKRLHEDTGYRSGAV